MKKSTLDKMLSVLKNVRVLALLVKLRLTVAVWVSLHGGKLEGIQSVSTISVCNPYCIARMKNNDSVCSHCYVASHAYKAGLMAHLIRNFELLTGDILPEDKLPMITSIFGRIESFGDVFNVTQARNYIRIIRKNPAVRFAIWSKNTMTWKKAFDIEGKPANCTFIVSSNQLNKPAYVPECVMQYVDYIFTVYNLDYVKAHDVKINCGLRKCMQCGHCYNRGNAMYVNELLKEDVPEYKAWLASKAA